ncbi:MAG: dihydrodipicolinate reductase [Roseiflexaceae bacterium]|nr:dihydrodipicolinate reductase [Roseiflexaceae bacterium]
MATRVVCYGLGPIGVSIARLACMRAGIQVIGAIDIDPQKAGRDLGELLGRETMGIVVSADAAETLDRTRPDVVLHATQSSLAAVVPQLQECIAAGADVISTCEELAYPWSAHPQLAADLDAAARAAGVTLLGAGVNPGYAMDALPIMLTAACAEVRAVRVLRIVDAAQRRGPLQRKIGAGLTTDEFAQRVREGTVRHVGLPESMHMIAAALGWRLDAVDDTITPVLAGHAVTTEHVAVEAGQVAGVHQVVRGYIGEREVITLELQMYVGAPDPQDTIEIDSDPPLRMTIPGGIHGDIATAAIVVNAIPSIRRAEPGLLSMTDVPLVHYW